MPPRELGAGQARGPAKEADGGVPVMRQMRRWWRRRKRIGKGYGRSFATPRGHESDVDRRVGVPRERKW
jgi:hypothetical protein